MARLDIEDVSKSFGTVEVLKSIDLSIEDGEFVCLVGPSGCGKSTLLRLIAGLEGIDTGRIRIGGNVVNDLTPKARNIAMVFQNYALYPHKSVFENLAFALRMRRMKAPDIQRQVDRAARILNIEPLLDRLPGQLSGGQRQRVAMGRAIVRDPNLFLFDEPLSNLDAQLRVTMRGEIRLLHQRLAATSVYVTHDQTEAMTMSDRIVVMNAGRIEQAGPPLELYDRPNNRFVAEFIGSPAMNLLPARVTRGSGGAVLRVGETFDLPMPPGIGASGGSSVSVGIRPSHIDLVGPDTGIAATVEVVEPLGDATVVLCRSGEVQLCVLSSRREHLGQGEPVHLRFDLDRLHVFDDRSGARL